MCLLVASLGFGNRTKAIESYEVFFDIDNVPWAVNAIIFLHDRGIVKGYDDHYFWPEANITREQAAIMLVRELYPNEISTTELHFPDVEKNSFYYNAIAVAFDHELLEGYPDGSFKPQNPITRAETAKILALAYDLQGTATPFIDLSDALWAEEYIKALASNRIVDGYPDDTYRPNNLITRAEYSLSFARLLDDYFRPDLTCENKANDMVYFQDSHLEEAIKIRGDIDLESGDITVADMCNLTYLNGSTFEPSTPQIKDLAGMEYAKNLNELYFLNNSISDIGPLSGLINLDKLSIANNNISDISALNGLLFLEELNLNKNKISDIRALKSLVYLDSLNLADNSISDISVLSGMKTLDVLDLSNNPLNDLGAISELTNLDILLLGNTSSKDIRLLNGLTDLYRLELENNSIEDLSPLSGMSKLEMLNLANNSLSDFSVLSEFTRLTTLYLENNSIEDISPLSGKPVMSDLNLSNNSIEDISPLSRLEYVDRNLNLSSNSISDIRPLSELKMVNTLNLSNNSISDINALFNVYSVRDINLENNAINDITILAFKGIRNLNLRGNPINDFSPLRDIRNLSYLKIDEDQLNEESKKVIEDLKAKGVTVEF